MPTVADVMRVPYGWRGARADIETWFREAGASSRRARLAVIARSPPLWAMVFYRFGRWLYAERAGNRWLRLACRIFHLLLRRPVLWVTRTSLPPQCEIGPGVWIASHDAVWVSPASRVGARTRLCGANSLGVGGRKGARGAPDLGEGVVMGPGATAVGPVAIADGAVIGPNSVVARSIPTAGTYVGSPPRPWKPDLDRMFPRHRNELAHAPSAEELFGTPVERVQVRSAFRADLARYLDPRKPPTALAQLRAFFLVEGLWALLVYRIGRWALAKRSAPDGKLFERVVAAAVWPFFRAAERFVSLLVDIRLDVRADIAPGFYVGHFKSIYVGPGVQIGAECNIGQMCFVGEAGPGFLAGRPKIGDRVYLGAGCKVVGPVTVGNDVAIGANAVVLANVPDRAVVVGNPARVINLEGSGDFISAFQHEEPIAPTPRSEAQRPAPEERAR